MKLSFDESIDGHNPFQKYLREGLLESLRNSLNSPPDSSPLLKNLLEQSDMLETGLNNQESLETQAQLKELLDSNGLLGETKVRLSQLDGEVFSRNDSDESGLDLEAHYVLTSFELQSLHQNLKLMKRAQNEFGTSGDRIQNFSSRVVDQLEHTGRRLENLGHRMSERDVDLEPLIGSIDTINDKISGDLSNSGLNNLADKTERILQHTEKRIRSKKMISRGSKRETDFSPDRETGDSFLDSYDSVDNPDQELLESAICRDFKDTFVYEEKNAGKRRSSLKRLTDLRNKIEKTSENNDEQTKLRVELTTLARENGLRGQSHLRRLHSQFLRKIEHNDPSPQSFRGIDRQMKLTLYRVQDLYETEESMMRTLHLEQNNKLESKDLAPDDLVDSYFEKLSTTCESIETLASREWELHSKGENLIEALDMVEKNTVDRLSSLDLSKKKNIPERARGTIRSTRKNIQRIFERDPDSELRDEFSEDDQDQTGAQPTPEP